MSNEELGDKEGLRIRRIADNLRKEVRMIKDYIEWGFKGCVKYIIWGFMRK